MPHPTLERAREVLHGTIEPALQELPSSMRSTLAARLVLAIMVQESDLEYRTQRGGGPAHGLAQFEPAGVKGVLQHPATQELAARVAVEHGVEPTATAIHEALASDDRLAAKFARLLLWTDPALLPRTREGSWQYYLRNWRPGKPHPRRWLTSWRLAQTA